MLKIIEVYKWCLAQEQFVPGTDAKRDRRYSSILHHIMGNSRFC